MTAEVEQVIPSDENVIPSTPNTVTEAVYSALKSTSSEEVTDDRNSVSPPVIITIRMIMLGKEVGTIIGKKGEQVKGYREQSGAKINITDASCPERIVTVTGSVEQINKAFDLICTKFEEIREMHCQSNPGLVLPPISVKLVIPASQCGSLIGKGGTKIKEIRENTGASVQVASDMLPGSTERAVTISGNAVAINGCIQEICGIMLESPPKGATIPYRPKPAIQAPLMYAAAAGAAAQAAYAMPHMQALAPSNGLQTPAGHLLGTHGSPLSTSSSSTSSGSPEKTSSSHLPPYPGHISQQTRQSQQPISSTTTTNAVTLAPPYSHPQLAAHQLQLQVSQGTPFVLPQPTTTAAPGAAAAYGALINPALLGGLNGMGLIGGGYINRPLNNNYMASPPQTTSTEMIIPNELIGCIIGRAGAKINEIRQLSGAQIKISNCEEGSNDRKVTITGIPETITLAAYLINTSLELHKSQILNSSEPSALTTPPLSSNPHQNVQPTGAAGSVNLLSTAAAAATTVTKPLSINPYSSLSAANGAAYGLVSNPLATATFGPLAPSAATLAAAYDPKTLINAAKFKVLPTAGFYKQEHRFAPY